MVIRTLLLFMSHRVKGDCLSSAVPFSSLIGNSLFDRDHLMSCKSGILTFIFAENNYLIYAHTLIKIPLLHQRLGSAPSFL